MSQTAFSNVLSLAGSLYICLLPTVWILVLHFASWKLTGFLSPVRYIIRDEYFIKDHLKSFLSKQITAADLSWPGLPLTSAGTWH